MKKKLPVMLPPGRLMLATNPALTGSLPLVKTIGMVAVAAALTGKCPALTTANGNGFRWFDQVQRGIRLRDGSGVATKGDQHPDPEVEAVRYQIHEAELVQALGRGRALNRTAVNPLDADLLF